MTREALISQLQARKAAIEALWLEAALRSDHAAVAAFHQAFRVACTRYWRAVVWLAD